jgi:DNA-binding transcriptional LysR family regulator
MPVVPGAIAGHDCIAFEGAQTYRSWAIGSGASAQTIPIKPRLSVNTADAVMDAAAAGLGVARLMSYQAADAIAAQKVALILREFAGDPVPVSLVHQAQRVQPLKRRAFLDFVMPRLSLALTRVDDIIRRA